MVSGRGAPSYVNIVSLRGINVRVPALACADLPRSPTLGAKGDVGAWGMCAAFAVHVAVAVALLWEPADTGARAMGQGGIVMAFELAGAASGSAVEETRNEPAEEVDAAKLETSPEITEEGKVLVPPEPVKAVEAPEPVERTAPPPPDVIAAVRPSRRPERPLEPEAKKAQTTEPSAVAAKVSAQIERGEAAEAKKVAASITGAGGLAPTDEAEGRGSGKSKAGGGVVGASADYLALLRAWLERHKDYPRRARVRREEGTVMLRVAFVTGGELLSYSVQRSSGYPTLDQAAESMLRRAQPFPPEPSGASKALEILVPVSFRLR